MSSQHQKPLRLLSLDGGGVRGLATLLILDNLTRRINPINPPKPCDCFDLIGGTSTGGLIAIMLGHLEMDVESCINAYVQLSSRIFRKKSHPWKIVSAMKKLRVKEMFSSIELEEAIKQIIERQGKQKDIMFRDEANPDPKCKVFVCVTRSENARNTCFRTYNSARGINPNCKTWEAGRATSAATTFFDPITIGPLGETYVDGATGVNNPVNEVLREARDIWPNLDERLQCFVSIGTGQPNFSRFGVNLPEVLKTLKNIATDTERTAESFLVAHRDLKESHRYFRFNVIRGLEGIGLEENKKIAEMTAATGAYLESEGVRVEMENCVKSLMRDLCTHTPTLQPKQTLFDTDHEFKENHEKIKNWLSPPSYQSEYENIRDERESNTCQWILEKDQFKDWNNGSSKFLWIHGGPGCGKSVIASTIIEIIENDNSKGPERKILSYAFCDKRDDSKKTPLALMKILVWQIISRQDLLQDQKQIIIATWRMANPSLDDMERCRPRILFGLFKKLLMPYTSCKIVLDGLDECESPGDILRWLIDLTKTSHVRLLLVSQNVSSISEVFDDNPPTVQITPDSTRADLTKYVDSHLPKILDQRKDVYLEVKEALLGNAEGMFLWVKLAMEQLKAAKRSIRPNTEARLLNAMHELPKELDRFYIYILRRILKDDENSSETTNNSVKQEICLALEWILVSFRPLRVDELQVAMSLSFPETNETPIIGPIDNNRESVTEFQDKILSLCAPILSVQPNGTVTVVHSSFQTFMENTARNHPTFQPLFPKTTIIHGILATTSIRYLQSKVFADFAQFTETYEESTVDDIFPFKKYATQYWWLHLVKSPSYTENNTKQLSKQLMEFVSSSQAITWLESSLYRDRSTDLKPLTLNDCILLQSNVSQYLEPSGPQDWVYRLVAECVKRRKTEMGEAHPHTLRAMASLALAYSAYGRFNETEELELQVLKVRRNVLGEGHPDTLETMGNLAVTYNMSGRFKEAEELQLEVLKANEELLGKEHAHTLIAMGNLAVTYGDWGRFKEAEEIHLRVLKLRSNGLGNEHPDTIQSMIDLAGAYQAGGRSKEAAELSIRVLGVAEAVLSKDHPTTLLAMKNLAASYNNLGQLRKAEEVSERIIEVEKRILGIEHLETLRTMRNLATVYFNDGRVKEAEATCLHVLDSMLKVLGKDHRDTMHVMGDLAMIYRSNGRLGEAEELGLQVLEATKRLFGGEHLDTLEAMTSLSVTYDRLGRLKEAEDFGEQALEARKKQLGDEHLKTIHTMGNLTATYQKNGRPKEAERLAIQVIETRKRLLGEDHPDTLATMGDLAAIYNSLGRFKEAEVLGARVLQARKKLFGEEHLDTIQSMANLATTYQKSERLEEAERLEKIVLEVRKRLLGEEHPTTLEIMGDLVVTYDSLGRLDEAESLGEQVLEAMKRLLGEENLSTLHTMGNLAVIYHKRGLLEKAEIFGHQVLRVKKRLLGEEHPDTLATMGSLAVTYDSLGRLIEAEELAVKVLEVRKRTLGEEHLDTLHIMANLAVTYIKNGRFNEAEKLELHVLESWKNILGKQHPKTRLAMRNLVTIYQMAGRFKEAEELKAQLLDAQIASGECKIA